MKVLKFGGTSVGNADNMLKVLAILQDKLSKKQQFVVVFSAMSGVTNKLIAVANMASIKSNNYLALLDDLRLHHITTATKLVNDTVWQQVQDELQSQFTDLADTLKGIYLIGELSPRSLDFVVSFGERLSTTILVAAARSINMNAVFIDTRELIKTNSNFGNAKIDFKNTNALIVNKLKLEPNIWFVTGFIASDVQGTTTTLGRGGSDYTASVLAAALQASEVEIWTDVDGVMTADPRKVKNAFSLPFVSYNEAMEMSHFGAKVIYPPTLQPVFSQNIPIRIKNTFNTAFQGTVISAKGANLDDMTVKGISSINDVSLLTLQGSGMVGVLGVSARLFGCLARANVNIILITQASSEHSITFAINPSESQKAQSAIKEEFALELETGRVDQVQVIDGQSVVAIIGANMKRTPGISGKVFSALGKNGVNVSAIAQGSSELNISAVIGSNDLAKALNALHDAFFLSNARTLHVFILGPGLIGKTLLEQMKNQANYLLHQRALEIKVIAIANSKKMRFDVNGIDLNTWQKQLQLCTQESTLDGFIQHMLQLNLPNSVFVDNTSSKEIVHHYHAILNASVSIVTPNKVANSGEYLSYKNLKSIAAKRGVKFLYETNVGAGLPIIGTLQGLINSGDEIIKIEAVLSGSLSFIFNTYNGSSSFKDVVLMAKEKGFTEPDPRDDLNGMDVARKILILAREIGLPLEPSDVVINNILPQNCVDAPTVDAFFNELQNSDKVFESIYNSAKAQHQKLCFVATLENKAITVALKAVDCNHPFNALSGSDNMISFTTKRYFSNPLVVKGPGAGAEVTAAGVFADIISISNYLS